MYVEGRQVANVTPPPRPSGNSSPVPQPPLAVGPLWATGEPDRGGDATRGASADLDLLVACERSLRVGKVREALPKLAQLYASAGGDERESSPRLEHLSALAAYYGGHHLQIRSSLARLPPGHRSEHLAALLDGYGSRPESAQRRLEALAAAGDRLAPCRLAEIHLARGAVLDAERCLDLAEASDPRPPEALYLRRVLARQRGLPVPRAEETECACTTIKHRLLDARLALDEGDLSLAEAASDEGLVLVDCWGLGLLAAEAWILRADLAARLGRAEEALARLDRARGRLPHPNAALARLIEVAVAVLTGRAVSEELLRSLVVRRDVEPLVIALRGLTPPPEASEVLRAAPSALRRLASRSFPVGGASNALLVSTDGARFRRPGSSSWVDLGRRRSQRLLLDALTRKRLEHPGVALDIDALLAAGWPGENVVPAARANRVHVALNGLRSCGLADIIERTSVGYRFDPLVPVLRVSDPIGTAS